MNVRFIRRQKSANKSVQTYNEVEQQKTENDMKIVYTNKELMKLLECDSSTLRKYREDGMLSYSRVRDKIYYTEQDIKDFLSHNHYSAYYYDN